MASEFIRNKIRFVLRSYVRQWPINIDQRLDNIKISLRNETHASNFGFTMEDAVIMKLETSGDILAKVISEVFYFTPSSTNYDVSRFTMKMKGLSIVSYCSHSSRIVLLLPASDRNEWVNAVLLCYHKNDLYVIGIRITTSVLTSKKISNSEQFLAYVQSQTELHNRFNKVQSSVFFISKERPKKNKKWWHFGQIDTELGRIMDDKYQQINGTFSLHIVHLYSLLTLLQNAVKFSIQFDYL